MGAVPIISHPSLAWLVRFDFPHNDLVPSFKRSASDCSSFSIMSQDTVVDYSAQYESQGSERRGDGYSKVATMGLGAFEGYNLLPRPATSGRRFRPGRVLFWMVAAGTGFLLGMMMANHPLQSKS